MAVPKRLVILDSGTVKALKQMTREQRWNFFVLMVRRIKRIQEQRKRNGH